MSWRWRSVVRAACCGAGLVSSCFRYGRCFRGPWWAGASARPSRRVAVSGAVPPGTRTGTHDLHGEIHEFAAVKVTTAPVRQVLRLCRTAWNGGDVFCSGVKDSGLAAIGAVKRYGENARSPVANGWGLNCQIDVGVAPGAPRLLSPWLVRLTGTIGVRGCGHARRFSPRPGSWRECSPQRPGPSSSGTGRG